MSATISILSTLGGRLAGRSSTALAHAGPALPLARVYARVRAPLLSARLPERRSRGAPTLSRADQQRLRPHPPRRLCSTLGGRVTHRSRLRQLLLVASGLGVLHIAPGAVPEAHGQFGGGRPCPTYIDVNEIAQPNYQTSATIAVNYGQATYIYPNGSFCQQGFVDPDPSSFRFYVNGSDQTANFSAHNLEAVTCDSLPAMTRAMVAQARRTAARPPGWGCRTSPTR